MSQYTPLLHLSEGEETIPRVSINHRTWTVFPEKEGQVHLMSATSLDLGLRHDDPNSLRMGMTLVLHPSSSHPVTLTLGSADLIHSVGLE
jgi:hypothetical protein